MSNHVLIERAQLLAGALEANANRPAVAARLRRSVIRPLEGEAAASGGLATAVELRDGDSLWKLALDATRQRAGSELPALQEAVAALQQLALEEEPTSDDERAARHAELRAIQADVPAAIQCAQNGPYLVTNAEHITDWLGQELEALPQMALCRCGESGMKPFCDGVCSENGFSDAKDPDRVPDKRDRYDGAALTVLDNRGICQHSGFCSDRLKTVFRVGEEPFVAASGGRMDEIIRAVRTCPSGALSYTIDGHEARAEVDHGGKREPTIEISKDGPYRITGAIPLKNADGEDEPRAHGASREHYALCRCGHSQNKPFCSGMHWYVEFKDPVPDPDAQQTVFQWLGGLPALTRLTRIFYEKYIAEDELLAPLLANMGPDHPDRVAKWLGEVFGGPKAYSTAYGGYARMVSQHMGKEITEEMRVRWVELIHKAYADAGLPNDPEVTSVFYSYIEWGSRLAVENSTAGAQPPENMPMPHWEWNTAAGPPGGRVSALAPEPEHEEKPPNVPEADEAIGFEEHVKTFFRKRDRQSMLFAFDLWAFDDVKQNAQAILGRLRAGTMPCDGAWPSERTDAFERWTTSGMAR
jgi:CDGSH-type Zn-finger protein/truncated hemoglobin YjbI